MGKGLLLVLALCCATTSATTVTDLLASLAGPFTDTVLSTCGCLITAVEDGECNQLCNKTGCPGALEALIECSSNTSICSETTCNGLLAGADTLGACTSFVDTVAFPDDRDICETGTASLNYLIDAFYLHEDVRASCQDMNAALAEGECSNVCDNTVQTCTDWLGRLQLCAKSHASLNCYLALNTMRLHVGQELVQCNFFELNSDGVLEGVCNIEHSDDGIYNFTNAAFDDIFPVDLGVEFGSDILTPCYTCLQGRTSQCTGLCSSENNTYCNYVTALRDCAIHINGTENITECDSCAIELDNFNTVLGSNFYCETDDDGNVVLDNVTGNASCVVEDALGSAGLFNCDEVYNNDSCADYLDAFENGLTVPVFQPVLSASPSPSPASNSGNGDGDGDDGDGDDNSNSTGNTTSPSTSPPPPFSASSSLSFSMVSVVLCLLYAALA